MLKIIIGTLCSVLLFSGCGKKRSSPSTAAQPPTVSTESDFDRRTPIPPIKGGGAETTDPDQAVVDPITDEQVAQILKSGDSSQQQGNDQQMDELQANDQANDQQAADSAVARNTPDSKVNSVPSSVEEEIVAAGTSDHSQQTSTHAPLDIVAADKGFAEEISSSISIQERVTHDTNASKFSESRLSTQEVQERLNQLSLGYRKEESVLTGSRESKTQLPFTGSQNDELLSSLKTKFASLENSGLSSEWAKKIGSVEIVENSSTPQLRIFWQNGEAYQLDTVSLVTQSQENSTTVLREGKSSQGYSVQQLCLDHSANCMTSVVKLTAVDQNLVAYIVVRKTSAHIHLSGNAAECSSNGPYQKFLAALQNSRLVFANPELASQKDHLSKASFTSFEVVNGSSAYDIQLEIKTENDCYETLSLRGALLTGLKSSVVGLQIPLSHQAKWGADGRLLNTAGILDSLNCAILQKNDGEGNLQFEMQFAGDTQGHRAEKFQLSILRNPTQMNIQSIQNF